MTRPGFRKTATGGDPGFFAVEAAGLRWLADAGPGSAPVVGVLEVHPTSIVLESLVAGRPTAAAAASFGRALAVTHAAGADAFGLPPAGWDGDGYIGRQTMSLRSEPRWGGFFADQRIWPYAERAHAIGHLSTAGLTAIGRIADRLRNGDFDDDLPPARIHGDLWAGNVFFTADGAVLIDPAAHGGHGLTDLAMLHLFGAPHLDTITAAYAEAADLPDAWPGLIALHQLHPVLVHAVSHGPAYGAEAERLARHYV